MHLEICVGRERKRDVFKGEHWLLQRRKAFDTAYTSIVFVYLSMFFPMVFLYTLKLTCIFSLGKPRSLMVIIILIIAFLFFFNFLRGGPLLWVKHHVQHLHLMMSLPLGCLRKRHFPSYFIIYQKKKIITGAPFLPVKFPPILTGYMGEWHSFISVSH